MNLVRHRGQLFGLSFLHMSSMIMVFWDFQVGQDRTDVTSFCVQFAARRAKGLLTDGD